MSLSLFRRRSLPSEEIAEKEEPWSSPPGVKAQTSGLLAGRKCFLVASGDGKLRDILTASDVRKSFEKGNRDGVEKDVMSRRIGTVFPDDTLQLAFEGMVLLKIGYLPVVDPIKHDKIPGILDRETILDRYKEVIEEEASQESLVHMKG